jgi:hypothetical protein
VAAMGLGCSPHLHGEKEEVGAVLTDDKRQRWDVDSGRQWW